MILFFKLIFLYINFLYSADGVSKSIDLRILIISNSKTLKIQTGGQVSLTELKTDQKYILLEDSVYEIKLADNDYIMVSDEKLFSPIFLETLNPQSYLTINGKKYRGRFKIIKNNNGIDVIEHIDIERYLWGVLSPEMGGSWPLEALKAQAVAARTYAVASLNKNAEYDMTSTTNHQVYTGFENISPQIIAAVNATRGEVLTYKDKIFFAYYHANSGGHTTTPSGAWNSNIIPPLKGVKDPYYKNSKHANWSVYISNSDLINFLIIKGYDVKKIKDLRIFSKDRSGRAVRLLIKADNKSIKVEAKDLRNFIGTFDIKSTLITSITKMKNGFKLTGRGWGHGVGLCQDGAKEMADRGFDYKKILSFYYPGSKIKDIEDVYYERR